MIEKENQLRATRFQVLALLTVFSLIGCQTQRGPETVSVTGTVTQGGQAVEGALVVFTPQGNTDSKLAAQAETDASGKFSLQTYLGGEDYKPGIEPGEYDVSVTKLEVVQDMRKRPKNLLPRKYSMPKTSGLQATVTQEGDNDFEFDL